MASLLLDFIRSVYKWSRHPYLLFAATNYV